MTAASAAPYAPSGAAGASSIPLGTSFVPSVGAIAAWTDNINLAPSGQEKSGELEDVEPGFSFTHNSALEQAELDYTLHALFFSSGGHDFLHGGHLFSATHLIPDWFELDVSGLREQGLANPALPADLTYLLPAVNLANYTTGLVKPTFKHAFSAFQAEASYTRGISDFGQVGAGGIDYRSNLQGADGALSSVDPSARVTWNGTYQRTQVAYESPYTFSYLYEKAGGELGVLTIPTLRILGRAGKESDPGTNGFFNGGLDSTYWAGGFDRSTGPSDDLKLLIGHRFFGRTYEGSWEKQSRLLRLDVKYIEQPNTEEGVQAGQSLATPPLVTIPGTYGFTQLGPGVFLQKSLNGAATITGRVTEIGLGVDAEQQQYYTVVAAPGLLIIPRSRAFIPVARPTIATSSTRYEDRYQTATLYARRQLGPVTTFNLSATYGKTEASGFANGENKLQRYSAMLTRRLGRWSSLYLRADHIREYGQLAPYTQNIASLGIKISFGQPAQSASGSRSGFGSPFGTNYGP